jgi:hypothetical protein
MACPPSNRRHGYELFPKDIGYLSHMLTYVREGIFGGLNNRLLRELGAELSFYPGLPGAFRRLKKHIEEDPRFSKHEIKLEHYIVSTGLRLTQRTRRGGSARTSKVGRAGRRYHRTVTVQPSV